MAYAIARVKKLKRANIAGSAAHTSRQRETPNADPTKQNIRFIGNVDRDEKLEDLVLAKIGQYEQKRKIRTDAVYCVEILLTASPSYFRPLDPSAAGYYEEERLADWLSATQQWLEKEYGDCSNSCTQASGAHLNEKSSSVGDCAKHTAVGDRTEHTAVGDGLRPTVGDRSPHRAVSNRIVRAELHLDEVTPHIHAYFVPLDENGQLRCNHFFDGRQKMRDFQESYFAAVQHLGLERGIRGSVAKHQDIKDFYRIVEEGKDLNSELTIAQMRAKAADRDRAVQSKSSMERTAKRLVKENESLRQRIKELEAEKEQLQQQAEQLSDLPLEDVAWQLGLDQDTSSDVGHTVVGGDKVNSSTLKGDDAESSVQGNRLRRSVAERTKRTAIGSYRCFLGGEHIIYINGSQWSHLAPDTQKTDAIAGAVNTQKTGDRHANSQKTRASAANAQKIGNVTANTQTTSVSSSAITGTGAIALVKHINGCNFREAIAWLNDRFGEEGMQRAVTHYARQQAQMVIQEQEAPQFVPPVPDKSNWHLVHDYLTKKRKLPTELVQELYQRGWVYADDQENAVFLLRNLQEEPTGAFLQGTRAEDNTLEENNTFTGYATGFTGYAIGEDNLLMKSKKWCC
jgi:Plasmid recombination enzyme/Protein of unknown function (DUF3991)